MGRPGRGHAQRSSRSSSIGRDTLFLRMSRERKKFFFATEAAASTPKNRCVYRELSSRLDRQAEGDVGPASAQAWESRLYHVFGASPAFCSVPVPPSLELRAVPTQSAADVDKVLRPPQSSLVSDEVFLTA